MKTNRLLILPIPFKLEFKEYDILEASIESIIKKHGDLDYCKKELNDIENTIQKYIGLSESECQLINQYIF